MTPTPPKPSRRRRGQAMLEYSIVTWVLVCGLVLASTVRIIPDGGSTSRQRKNLIELFIDAYQTYYDSFYFVLNSPFP